MHHRVLVIHRNCLFRDCLTNYLKAARKDEACSLDHSRAQEIDEMVKRDADIILLDLNLPDRQAIEIVNSVRAAAQAVKIILIVPDDHELLFECIAAGVDGCVLEQSSLEELNSAIESVLLGETFCSVEFAKTMFSSLTKYSKFAWTIPKTGSHVRLTIRERQVLELIAERKCNKEIARKLSVSLYTIKNHVHNILEKLNVGNRTEAVEVAQQENLLSRI